MQEFDQGDGQAVQSCGIAGLADHHGARPPCGEVNKIRPVSGARARLNGERRAAHGLPRIDADTLAATVNRAGNAVDEGAVRDVLAVFGSDDRLWTEDLLSRLAEHDGRYAGWTGEALAGVLAPLGVRPVQVKINGRNRNGYRREFFTIRSRS
ncbi:hypothetical protein [Saccharothrix violaceirubra]|uniref:DUF3631 domain-containing protein n=1 Tax=Saccharothrix violaceirubra TaxID=413306 RepID=A0A7W7WXC9_9PSEU|nr:hypothetical protein [Saccharothrix violaceirubra]MBB4967309.1 hypothetical protein [Saccharothrix violaceirubra]